MKKAIILAAGKGTRMKSKLPKVLHHTAGTAMINQVLAILEDIEITQATVVLGHEAEQVEAALETRIPVQVVLQKEQLGTGHAVMQAKDHMPEGQDILIICGDTPLFRPETLRKAQTLHNETKAAVTVLTSIVGDPTGYGRIIRNDSDHSVEGIVEEKDAKPEQKKIAEINTGTYIFNGTFLKQYIDQLTDNNAQGEFYLTDLLPMARSQELTVSGYVLEDPAEALGINDRVQLAEATQILYQRKNLELMKEGVTIIDPAATYISPQVQIAPDVTIYPNVMIEGRTTIGEDSIIGPDVRIVDCVIGKGNTIERAKLWEATVGDHCSIGPYAYLRPAAELKDNVKVGDFVEIKKSVIGKGSKVPHLAYVGDAIVGEKVNIGCGVITANYDGKNKHTTVMEDGSFIGTNVNLVAPVTIGKEAFIAAGSTITNDVPDKHLAIARGRQRNIDLKGRNIRE